MAHSNHWLELFYQSCHIFIYFVDLGYILVYWELNFQVLWMRMVTRKYCVGFFFVLLLEFHPSFLVCLYRYIPYGERLFFYCLGWRACCFALILSRFFSWAFHRYGLLVYFSICLTSIYLLEVFNYSGIFANIINHKFPSHKTASNQK